MATIFDGVPKDNVKDVTKRLKEIAREFEVDKLDGQIEKELQDLIEFMDPDWKPKK